MSNEIGEHNYTKQSFTTETGEQTLIPVNSEHDVTISLKGTTSDDIDIEIVLDNPDDSPTRLKLVENVLAANALYIKTLEGPIRGIGIDIDGNSSNDITLQVLTSKRSG